MGTAADIDEIVASLRAVGDPEWAVNEQRYLKSDLTHFGASVPAIRRVVTLFAKTDPKPDRAGLLALVEGL